MTLDAILSLAVAAGHSVVYTAEGWTVQEGAKTVVDALDAHVRIVEANRRRYTGPRRPARYDCGGEQSRQAYWRGCRCQGCTAENARYARERGA